MTSTIFIRSMINVLEKRETEEFNSETIKKIFLKDGSNIKLHPVGYDKVYFDTLIIEGVEGGSSNTV